MTTRLNRFAAGGGAAPALQVLGTCGDRFTWLQVVNTTGHAVQVWMEADGVPAVRVETIPANSPGVLHAYPGDDMRVGLTCAGPAGNYLCWLNRR
jgi:hypothetical protein